MSRNDETLEARRRRYTCSIFYFAYDHPPNNRGKLYTLAASERKFVYLSFGWYDYLFEIVCLLFWPIEESGTYQDGIYYFQKWEERSSGFHHPLISSFNYFSH